MSNCQIDDFMTEKLIACITLLINMIPILVSNIDVEHRHNANIDTQNAL